jgi:ferredoxin
MRERAKELLTAGEVAQVLAWEKGELPCYPAPAFFTGPEALDTMVYDRFCTANLSKYMIEAARQPGRTLVFLRPCDAYSLEQLIKENQVKRGQAYIIGIGCEGCVVVDDGEERGLLEGCRVCTKTGHPVYDELIGADIAPRMATDDTARFADVRGLEAAGDTERYAFWRVRLSKCIRCNACRNICPTCHCKLCVFDGERYDTRQRTNATSFEGQFFHVIRAYHQAGRCTDCGQCSRVCPQGIPLQILNRKLMRDAAGMEES